MPSAHGAHVKYAWQRQPDAYLSLPNPVSGALNPVLAPTEDVRIISITANLNWTVQPSPLEVHVTIDGQDITHLINNPVTSVWYFARITESNDEANQELHATAIGYYRAFLYEGQNITITAETTGGTVQRIYCRVKWDRLLPT
jgi:hypothetical protein